MAVETPDLWTTRGNSDGAFAIACAIVALTRAIDRLGNADAASPMGAMEALGKILGEKIDDLALATSDVAIAITELTKESA